MVNRAETVIVNMWLGDTHERKSFTNFETQTPGRFGWSKPDVRGSGKRQEPVRDAALASRGK